MKKAKCIALTLALGGFVSLASSLVANAAGTYSYNLIPPGLGIQRNSDSVTKNSDERDGRNRCTKVQNDKTLEGWIERQSDGDDMTFVVPFTTNVNSFYTMTFLVPGEQVNGESCHFSVEVDSVKGYNCYGYWSPDNWQ